MTLNIYRPWDEITPAIKMNQYHYTYKGLLSQLELAIGK